MSLATFIPEVWESMLLVSLKKSLVYGADDVANRRYEGRISDAGDTVTINSVSRPTIGTYVPNSTTITAEKLTTAQRKLVVDQAKYFAFEVDDVDARQAAGDVLPEGLAEAAYGLRDVADQYIAALHTGVQSANAIGTVAVTSAALAYTQINKLRTKLNEANVPYEGRWVIIPPWYEELLLEDDRFVRADAAGTTDGLRNGIVGRALGFSIRVSNNAPLVTGDDYAVMAGYPGAISFAEQINKVEAYRPEDSFSDAVKGLHLYGAKLVRPDGIATVIASQS